MHKTTQPQSSLKKKHTTLYTPIPFPLLLGKHTITSATPLIVSRVYFLYVLRPYASGFPPHTTTVSGRSTPSINCRHRPEVLLFGMSGLARTLHFLTIFLMAASFTPRVSKWRTITPSPSHPRGTFSTPFAPVCEIRPRKQGWPDVSGIFLLLFCLPPELWEVL